MTIVLATDDNFVQHCCVAMASVLKHNQNVFFYIFTEGISKENVLVLKNLVSDLGGHLEIILVDSNIVGKFPMPANADAHISIATYYRLFTALLLPNNVEKAIYMDCDMVVRKSMQELWNTALSSSALGAVYQPISQSQEADLERLSIPKDYGYFNAGLLLLNLKYWRECAVTDRLLAFIKNRFASIKQHDQDVLNAVLYSEAVPLNYTWNYLPPFINVSKLSFPDRVDYSKQETDPAVVHFVSAPKPWEYGCRHPFRKEYYKYLSYTPFKDFSPSFNWKKYYKNCLRIWLLNFICKIDLFNIRKLIR